MGSGGLVRLGMLPRSLGYVAGRDAARFPRGSELGLGFAPTP